MQEGPPFATDGFQAYGHLGTSIGEGGEKWDPKMDKNWLKSAYFVDISVFPGPGLKG